MIEMPSIVGDVVRSVGLSTAMKAAGVVTGLLPIPQPMLLVGPGASRRLGQALCGFGHRKILIVTDRTIAQMGLPDGLTKALTEGGTAHVVFDAITPDAPIPLIEKGIAFYEKHRCDAIVAFGGGSPMDAAKTIALAVANKKHPQQAGRVFQGPARAGADLCGADHRGHRVRGDRGRGGLRPRNQQEAGHRRHAPRADDGGARSRR